MVKVQSVATAKPTSRRTKVKITNKVNGTTYGTRDVTVCTAGSLSEPTGPPAETWTSVHLESIFEISGFGSCNQSTVLLQSTIATDAGALLDRDEIEVSANGTYKLNTYWNYSRNPDGAPTYLETLDKLDQWSRAQYIPDIRKSGNKLNL